MIGTILSFIGWRYILIALIVVGGVGTGINYIVSWVSPSNSTNLKKEEKVENKNSVKELKENTKNQENKNNSKQTDFWEKWRKELDEKIARTDKWLKEHWKANDKFTEEWNKELKEKIEKSEKQIKEDLKKSKEFKIDFCDLIGCKKQDQLAPKSDKENNPPKIENQEKEVATPENTN